MLDVHLLRKIPSSTPMPDPTYHLSHTHTPTSTSVLISNIAIEYCPRHPRTSHCLRPQTHSYLLVARPPTRSFAFFSFSIADDQHVRIAIALLARTSFRPRHIVRLSATKNLSAYISLQHPNKVDSIQYANLDFIFPFITPRTPYIDKRNASNSLESGKRNVNFATSIATIFTPTQHAISISTASSSSGPAGIPSTRLG